MAEFQENIVSDPQSLKELCKRLANSHRMAFDTEFVAEENYEPIICLIQVATDEIEALIDPFEAGPLHEFWEFFLDENREIVFHAGREEILICRRGTGHPPARIFDTQIAAGLVGFHYPIGCANLVDQCLDVRMSKSATRTEWRQRPLSTEQIHYALDDVRFLLPIRDQLGEKLTQLGRTSWAEEEFQRFNNTFSEESQQQERWRKLRGVGNFGPHRLAITKDLFIWREKEASRRNRPVRSVCRDDLLVEVARRKPRREREIEMIRGINKRYAREMLGIATRAAALPIDQCPKPAERTPDPPALTTVSNILSAVYLQLCREADLAPGLALTSREIQSLVRNRIAGIPDNSTDRLHTGWRAEKILPVLDAVLNGNSAVSVADLHSDNPLRIH